MYLRNNYFIMHFAQHLANHRRNPCAEVHAGFLAVSAK